MDSYHIFLFGLYLAEGWEGCNVTSQIWGGKCGQHCDLLILFLFCCPRACTSCKQLVSQLLGSKVTSGRKLDLRVFGVNYKFQLGIGMERKPGQKETGSWIHIFSRPLLWPCPNTHSLTSPLPGLVCVTTSYTLTLSCARALKSCGPMSSPPNV